MRTVLVLVVLATAASADALTITDAKIAKGAVQVKGKGAVPFAAITFDGAAVATATKSGAFKFATDRLPSDCVGDVSDGSSTVGAVVTGCTRGGSVGLVVVDATGQIVGPYFDSLDAAALVLPSPEGLLAARLDSGDFTAPSLDLHYYESVDCTTEPLFQEIAVRLGAVRGVVRRSGSRLFYAGRNGRIVTVRASNYRADDPLSCVGADTIFTPPDRCCDPVTPSLLRVAPLESIDVGHFVPPFRVELR